MMYLYLIRALMVASIVLISTEARSQDICVSTPEGREASLRLMQEIQFLQRNEPVPFVEHTKPLFSLNHDGIFNLPAETPWGTRIPYTFSQYGQRGEQAQTEPPTDLKEDLVPYAIKCLGEYGCMHNQLHPYYQYAFRKLGCYCHTGQCRPTIVRRVDVIPNKSTKPDDEPTGYQVLANGKWCDVPKSALRRDRQLIPDTLLQFRAHVCVSATSCDQLECAIIDEGT